MGPVGQDSERRGNVLVEIAKQQYVAAVSQGGSECRVLVRSCVLVRGSVRSFLHAKAPPRCLSTLFPSIFNYIYS